MPYEIHALMEHTRNDDATHCDTVENEVRSGSDAIVVRCCRRTGTAVLGFSCSGRNRFPYRFT